MRAIMIMFDSLNRHFLPAWNETVRDLPNFKRLQQRTVAFDRCYVGSMPCMPARRDLHTGRLGFLHRSWGPLEPFDDSVPELLQDAGVYTHLVTDHQHYWEDGGATYHNRFSSYEFFRGQEGDPWKGHVADPEIPKSLSWRRGRLWRQDWINRTYMATHEDHSQTRTMNAGLDFIKTNQDQQNWFLQIECFDPHEPFFASPEFAALVDKWDGDHFDWPDYRTVLEDDETVDHLRQTYAALVAMCDASLGRVLDAMDEGDMWGDTALFVCTDHGLMLGEREWFGKNVQPWFNEIANTPLYAWVPGAAKGAERRSALVQTIDLGPTLLDVFGLERQPDMEGRSIIPALKSDQPIRKTALFGMHGGHVNITDGRYVYMRAPPDRSNSPIEEYTLMPTRMNQRFAVADLKDAELNPPFPFTKGTPVLKARARPMGNPYFHGTRLYDLDHDPGQKSPIDDAETERHMATLMVDAMRKNHAPPSQFERLGLPVDGPIEDVHLLAKTQRHLVEASDNRSWKEHPASGFGTAINTVICDLVQTPQADIVASALGIDFSVGLAQRFSHLTPWHLAVMLPSVLPEHLYALDRELEETLDA